MESTDKKTIEEHKEKIMGLIIKSNFPNLIYNEYSSECIQFKRKLEYEMIHKKLISINFFGKNLIKAFANHFGEKFFTIKYFTFVVKNNITDYKNILFLLSYIYHPNLFIEYSNEFKNPNETAYRTIVPSKKENSPIFTNCCFWLSCEQNIDFIRCTFNKCHLYSTSKINVKFYDCNIYNNGITFSKISNIKNIFYLIINRGNILNENDTVSKLGSLNRVLNYYLIDVLNFIIFKYIGLEELYKKIIL
jgi:hypothetical protein